MRGVKLGKLVRFVFLIREGLPKRVCALENGMFISDRLSGLKSFPDYKDFVAVVQCMSKKEMSFFTKMEPPRHDAFEPGRLHYREGLALKGLGL